MPSSRFTKCPKLDTTLKSKLPKQSKDADRLMAKAQALLLDAVGPLAHILEQPDVPQNITEVVTQSLKFLGNASATISNERCRRAGAFFNEDLKCLIEEEKKFKDAAPLLFGSNFLTTAKDHAESVKALDKLSSRRGRPTGQQFFRSDRPFNQAARGGSSYGSSYRAGSNNACQNGNFRGRGRYRPYLGRDQRPRKQQQQQQQQQ